MRARYPHSRLIWQFTTYYESLLILVPRCIVAFPVLLIILKESLLLETHVARRFGRHPRGLGDH
jgi:hypothetical protein